MFLDEVRELSPSAQAALLRVLDTKRVVRLGASTDIPTDFRLLTATNRNLEEMVQDGSFRLDLFHRINTLCLRLPPLRERTIEIPPLIATFIQQANHRFDRSVTGVDTAASNLLMQYQWPGNVRELRNVIDRAVLIAKRSQISPTELPQMVQKGLFNAPTRFPNAGPIPPKSPPGQFAMDEDGGNDLEDKIVSALSIQPSFKHQIQQCEEALIGIALRKHSGNITQAAGHLVMPRRTLAYKVRVQRLNGARNVAAETTLFQLSTEKTCKQPFAVCMKHIERQILRAAMVAAADDPTLAAQTLDMDRRTLVKKLRTLDADGTDT